MSKLNKTSLLKDNRFLDTKLAGGAGLKAARQDAEALLRRAVLASLLWEDFAYETGSDNAENVAQLIPQVAPEIVASIAVEARKKQKLRHMPLYIAREMARYPKYNALLDVLLPQIITRADQITDFVTLYWKPKKQPLTNKVKQGLAASFNNFTEYHFSKYNRDTPVKFRDVLFMVHAHPKNDEQAQLFKKIVDNTLETANTWETALSAGADKKETFTRLINENALGSLATLRNLRNMKDAGVEYSAIVKALNGASGNVLLPLNYYSAYKHTPDYAREIEKAMFNAYANVQKLPGHTVFIVDVSGSMGAKLSTKTEYSVLEVAAVLAMFAAETSERVSIYATAGTCTEHKTAKIVNHRGFALVDAITQSAYNLSYGGIFTRQCLDYIKNDLKAGEVPDRIIVFSDSQDCDLVNKVPAPFAKNNYIVDVSAMKHGINYKGVWTAEVSGWSENFMTYIANFEGINQEFQQD